MNNVVLFMTYSILRSSRRAIWGNRRLNNNQ